MPNALPKAAGPPASLITWSTMLIAMKGKLCFPSCQRLLPGPEAVWAYDSPMDKFVFAQRLRQTREKKGVTQADVAAACKNREGEPLSRAAVAQWETMDPNKRTVRPSFENLVEAAKILDTSIDYLVGLRDIDVPLELSDDALKMAVIWDRLSLQTKSSIMRAIDWAEEMEDRTTPAIDALLYKVTTGRTDKKR